jgi:hypothetical protein
MKREVDDPKMSPFWHGVSLLAPFWSWGRVSAHFQTLNRMRQNRQIPPAMGPLVATLLFIAYSVASAYSSRSTAPSDAKGLVAIGAIIVVTILIIGGQSSLNGYWRSFKREGTLVPTRVHAGEWLTLFIGFGVWILGIIGSAKT